VSAVLLQHKNDGLNISDVRQQLYSKESEKSLTNDISVLNKHTATFAQINSLS
jgi:hypothetical protein